MIGRWHGGGLVRRPVLDAVPPQARTVLLTGASRGIGAATAQALAGRGHRLLLTGRDGDLLRDVATRCAGHFHAADLARATGIEAVAAWADEQGPPDVLVLNAGVGWAGPLEQMTAADVERVLAVDLLAPVQLTRLLLPGVRARAGQVVLVSSIAGHVGVRDEAVYAAAKAALVAFADSLRWELAGSGVAVSVISPGAVDTGFFERRGRPYDRRWPAPVMPQRVAQVVADAVEHHGPDEVFVPTWLRLPARLQGALPALTARLAQRYG